MLTILYFARLREVLGVSTEQVDLPQDVCDIASLTQWLRMRGGAWETELAPGKVFRVAVNQVISDAQTPLAGGDEIAFFPPVTGG